MGISGRWNFVFLVGLVKNLEENAVRSCPTDIGLVEDVDDVFDIFLLGNAFRHLKEVEKER